MFEVTDACHNHGDAVIVAVFDAVVVANRAARLNNGSDAGCMCDFNAIGKREESVGGKNSSVQIEIE